MQAHKMLTPKSFRITRTCISRRLHTQVDASRSHSTFHSQVFMGIRGHPFMTSTRRGEGVRLRWTGGPAPCGRPHRKLKLESTDVILSSSGAKKLASFLPEFRLWTEKWKFLCDIDRK